MDAVEKVGNYRAGRRYHDLGCIFLAAHVRIPPLYAMFKWATAERITATCTVVITVTGLAAFILAYRQLHQDHEESQVAHVLDLDKQYATDPMISYRKAYADKRLRGVVDPDEEFELLDFFEGVGQLTRRGYLDLDDVYNYFSEDIFYIYADTRDEIDQTQKDDPPEYENLLWLVQRLEPIEAEKHGTQLHPSKDDLRSYWQGEELIIPGSPAGLRRRTASTVLSK